jgi:GT2 family glycosyltransferase
VAGDPFTSVVLPAYVPTKELLDVTRRCVASLQATTPRASYELIAVDNGSSAEAGEWLEEVADTYPVVLDGPVGYARAANIGLAVAAHDWLCVINTDIEFQEEGWLEQLQKDYAKTEGGVLSTFDTEWDAGRPAGIHYDESWFSCWLTRRDVIQKVGYFDESMGYRFHDQDYAIRVKRAGYEVMRDGNVVVKHSDSATYDTMNRDDSEEQKLLEQKWGADCFAQWLYRGQPAPA